MERIRPDGAYERFLTLKELQELLKRLKEDINTCHLTLCAAHTDARLGEVTRLTRD